jgi:hypothetical protein
MSNDAIAALLLGFALGAIVAVAALGFARGRERACELCGSRTPGTCFGCSAALCPHVCAAVHYENCSGVRLIVEGRRPATARALRGRS